jgi:hypothetical protein
MRHAWLAPLLLALAPACADEHKFTEGNICLDAGALASFAEGDRLEVVVLLDDCMACPKEFSADCDVEREGGLITLHARGWYTQRSGSCDTCLDLKVGCVVGGLSPGTYTIRSGEHEVKVTLPQAEPPQLDPVCDGL